jgi:hypothetical protein
MTLRLLQKLRHHRSKTNFLRKRVSRALALHRRGEVRADGLKLCSIQTTVRVEWTARDVHPWDRQIDNRLRERLFARQCLEDVDAAITRLFEQLPELDVLEFRVFYDDRALLLFDGRTQVSAAHAPGVIEVGEVERAEVGTASHLPSLMKLKSMGIQFRVSNWRLEPLGAFKEDEVGAT